MENALRFVPSAGLSCSQFVSLYSLVPPTIVKYPGNISIDEGDTIILKCEATGFPVPRVFWYFNDSSLVANSSFVEIVNAKKGEHEGRYRCVVKNPAGSISASANLKVNKSECLLYIIFSRLSFWF